MIFEKLEKIDQIKQFDNLVISDGVSITLAKANVIKISDYDGTEVIFDVRYNKYFNVGIYLDGKSWAKEIFIIRIN